MDKSDQDAARRRFLRRMLGASGVAAVTLIAPRAFADAHVVVRDVRMSHAGGRTRVVFDLSGPVAHHLFTLSNPERVVIDFSNTAAPSGLRVRPLALVRDVRYARRHAADLRVVLDLNGPGEPSSFLLEPRGASRNYRLVIDLADPSVRKGHTFRARTQRADFRRSCA